MNLRRKSKAESRKPARPLKPVNFGPRLSTRDPRPRSGAFTLIEIIVALAILGMVVAGIYSSWIAIVRGAKVGLASAAEVQRSRMAIRTLEDALTAARSFNVDLQYYSFDAQNGSDASLSFVARLSETFPRSGKFGDFDVRRVTFAVEPGPDSSKQLVLRQMPILMPDYDKDEKEHPIVLARNVKDLILGFWDEQKKDWVDEWNDSRTNNIPKLVRVTLRLSTGDQYSSQVNEVTRIIAPASVTVQTSWQSPAALPGATGAPGIPGQLPGIPGRPGVPPVPLPGGQALPQ